MVRGKRVDPRVPSEEHEQIVFITRVRFLYPLLANNVMAIPNGGWRNKAQAALLKRAGVLRGAPDLLIALVRKEWPGLFIEMKRVKGGVVSPDQKIVHQALRSAGYKVEVAQGADMAWEIFEEYVNGSE
jgi:hypothetical protein